MRPLHARVTVEIAGLDPGQAWSYVPRELAPGFEGGSVTVRAEATYDAGTGALASAHATATGIVVQPDGWTARRIEMGPVDLTATDVVYQDGAVTAAHVTMTAEPVLVDARGSEPEREAMADLRVAIDDARYPRGDPARVSLTPGLPGGGASTPSGASRSTRSPWRRRPRWSSSISPCCGHT